MSLCVFSAPDGAPTRLADGSFQWEAEDFAGGAAAKNGTDYKDATPGNQGGKHRETDADIEACAEGGCNVGFIDPGEWLKYSLPAGGTFVARIRHASPFPAAVHFEIDGADRTGPVALAATGGFQSWGTTVSAPFTVPAGAHVVTLVCETSTFNINRLAFVPAAAAAEPAPAPERFVDNGDGTITDTWRRLMWTKADSGRELNWAEARDWCAGLTLAGHEDWRLPTGHEIDRKLFEGLQPPGKWIGNRLVAPFQWTGESYWSSTDGDAGHGRPGMNTKDFKQGYSGTTGRGNKSFARACRSLPRPAGPRFKVNGDGTITDRWEGLTWALADSRRAMTVNDAEEWCRSLELGGKRNWRLPTFTELHDALYVGLEELKPGLGLDRRIAPFAWSGEAYWTTDTIVLTGAAQEGGRGRDVVRFVDGSHGWASDDNLRFVRACRDGF